MIREWSKQYGSPFFVGIFAALSMSGFSAPLTQMTAENCAQIAKDKFSELDRKPSSILFELAHERKGGKQLIHLKRMAETGAPELFEYSMNAKAFDEFMLARENSFDHEYGLTVRREQRNAEIAANVLRGTAGVVTRKDRNGNRVAIATNPLSSAEARALVREIVQDACFYLTTAGKTVEK
ncbi:MAG: hypothetical protein JST04_04335 [Bdellovibrionales bacterium]|nr:hypothetical protein [Bdellovibrionales bacterium]